MLSSILIILAVGLSIQLVYGYPSGPPVSSVKGLCDSMNPTGHGPSKATGEPPYTITISSSTYKANATIQGNRGPTESLCQYCM